MEYKSSIFKNCTHLGHNSKLLCQFLSVTLDCSWLQTFSIFTYYHTEMDLPLFASCDFSEKVPQLRTTALHPSICSLNTTMHLNNGQTTCGTSCKGVLWFKSGAAQAGVLAKMLSIFKRPRTRYSMQMQVDTNLHLLIHCLYCWNI